MAFRTHVDARGIAEVVIDNPPVNALGVAAWAGLARKIEELGRDPAVRVLVLRADGRGFQAGVDVKELAKDGRLIVDALGTGEDHARRSKALNEIVRGQSDIALGQTHVKFAAHRPVEPGPRIGLGRPFAFVEPA